jgi:DsbC/DsbD-like thiol-disulfide interchange protein
MKKTNAGIRLSVLVLSGGLSLGLAPCATALEETPFASAAVKAKTSSARLLMGDAGANGAYLVGVEIDLAPKTVTYWRQPGEAGEPPVFDFSRSENLGSVEALYPKPKHIEEAGSVVAGYDARVIFPVRVAAADGSAPIKLRLDLSYAACKTLCLPARAQLALVLAQGEAMSPFAGEIQKALTLVPRKLSPEESKALFTIARRDGEPTIWRLHYSGPGNAQDVFTETPDPLYLDTARAKDGDGFDLTLATNGAAPPPAGVAATLTIVTDQGAFQTPALLK